MIQTIKNQLFTILLVLVFAQFSLPVRGQNVMIPTGSFLIKTGNTVGSGLKPYGLIYQLVTGYEVPVYWCINPGKVKDGLDFVHNGVTYGGGTFAINARYITPAVASVINNWQNTQGIDGYYSISPFLAPVYDTITTFPRLLVDNSVLDYAVLINYFNNAGIPASAYSLGGAAALSGCHDMFASPHNDPTWNSHNPLRNFTLISKGNIWMQCHQVSVLEGLCDPGNSSIRLNFLTTNGLACYKANSCGCVSGQAHAKNRTDPTSYFYPNHPIMQFLGLLDDASNDGNEKWFKPNTSSNANINSTWNGLTSRGVRTSDGISTAEGAMLVYGPAYNNTSNGMVMYQAAHDLNNGTEISKVAAQRPFFNFLLLTGLMKGLTATTTIPSSTYSNASTTFNAFVTNGIQPYTYQWSATAGVFSAPNSATTTYTAPVVTTNNDSIIEVRLKVTDGCGRVNIILYTLSVQPSALPVELLTFDARPEEGRVKTEWVTASERQNDFFTVERSLDASSFEPLGNVAGAGNSNSMRYYSYVDTQPVQGNSYYRLKQTDFDGSVVYSRIVPVKTNSKDISVFPNPASQVFYIDLTSLELIDAVEIKLTDMAGREVYRGDFTLSSVENTMIEMQTDRLAKGLYTLECNTGNVWCRKRIVIR